MIVFSYNYCIPKSYAVIVCSTSAHFKDSTKNVVKA